MPHSNDRPQDRFRDRRDHGTHRQFRSEDHRGGIYGSSGQSDRTYDPNRFRSEETLRELGRDEDYDRFRDFSRTYEQDERRFERGGPRDYGYGRYGMNSGFVSGAEYGGYGRGSDYGSFDRGDDLVFGRTWGHGGLGRELDSGDHFESPSISRDFEHVRGIDFVGRGPRSAFRPADLRMIHEICRVLERHPGVDATEIEVDAKEGIVTLRGWVEDREQKRLAEFAVERVSGVRDVFNQLKIE